MAQESSFTIVSKVDHQETINALNQTEKEINQRYDFKGTNPTIEHKNNTFLIKANSEEKTKAILDVFQTKLIKRGISLKSLETKNPQPTGKNYQLEANIKEGLPQEQAKKISKIIREEAPKTIKTQIQGEEIKVTSKNRDDLQEVITILKNKDLEIDLQFTNYR